MSKIENCGNCGGTHYGSVDCPYLEKNMGEPCAVCGERTSYCCADCAIDGAGKVYVCITDACRTEHEKKHGLKPLDKDILHMLGGRAKADAAAGLTTSHIETEYLAELVRLAGTVLFPAFSSTKQ